MFKFTFLYGEDVNKTLYLRTLDEIESMLILDLHEGLPLHFVMKSGYKYVGAMYVYSDADMVEITENLWVVPQGNQTHLPGDQPPGDQTPIPGDNQGQEPPMAYPVKGIPHPNMFLLQKWLSFGGSND